MRNVNELTISSREFNKLKSCFYVPLLGGILYTGECNKSKWGNRPLILVLGILELNRLHINSDRKQTLIKEPVLAGHRGFRSKTQVLLAHTNPTPGTFSHRDPAAIRGEDLTRTQGFTSVL